MCLGSTYKSSLEKKMDWNIILLSQMPSKAPCFWPLQRKSQRKLLAKITLNENTLVIDLFKYDQRSKHLANSFFLKVRKRGPNLLENGICLYEINLDQSHKTLKREDKRCTDNDKKKKMIS